MRGECLGSQKKGRTEERKERKKGKKGRKQLYFSEYSCCLPLKAFISVENQTRQACNFKYFAIMRLL